MMHSSHPESQARRIAVRGIRCGLTLLELVVVLGVLAVLATVAVRSLEPIADQARYERTVRLLHDVRQATTGDRDVRDSNGSLLPNGLLADCGLLPTTGLELYEPPTGLALWDVQTFDSNGDGTDDLSLASGWNGPYLELPIGQATPALLEDGWGRELVFSTPTANTLEVASTGSDGAAGGASYAEDLAFQVAPDDYQGSVVFHLYDIDPTTGARVDPDPTGDEKMMVRFYGVNAAGGTDGTIELTSAIVASVGTFEVRFTGCMQGAAAARALLWEDADGNSLFDSGETVVRESRMHYVTVLAGREQRVEMELR